MPRLRQSFQQRWPTLIPLFLLIFVLVSGRTPCLAAFCGITLCAIVGLSTRVAGNRPANWALLVGLHAVLAVRVLGGLQDERAKVAVFAVGALAGVGFKLSTIITGAANAMAGGLGAWLPATGVDPKSLALAAALVMTGLVRILLGCGIPTTANDIIMVSVAAPTRVLMGVEPLVAHFFVFYQGVLADSTPPVALAAYAAAGMAGSDPFKTGNMAFRLGLAKALVPFVFSPSLLLVAKGFIGDDFSVTFIGCGLGISLLAAALSECLRVKMRRWEQALCSVAALLMVVPGLISTRVGAVVAAPVQVALVQVALVLVAQILVAPVLVAQTGRWRVRA